MNRSTNQGIGFSSLLLLLFITLKLCDVIKWNWWWVLSPVWIPLLVVVFILLVSGIIYVTQKK